MLNFRGVVILVWFPFFHPKKILSSQAHHATLETPHLRSHPFPWEKTDFWRGSQGTKKKFGREFLDRFFYESVKVLQDFDVILNTRICDFPRFSSQLRALERMEKAFKSSCEE